MFCFNPTSNQEVLFDKPSKTIKETKIKNLIIKFLLEPSKVTVSSVFLALSLFCWLYRVSQKNVHKVNQA